MDAARDAAGEIGWDRIRSREAHEGFDGPTLGLDGRAFVGVFVGLDGCEGSPV